MSRFLLLPFFLLFISCESEKVKTPTTVGNVRRYAPLELRDADYSKVFALCKAVAEKEGVLSVLVSSAQEYTFDYAQKDCATESYPPFKSVVTTIQGFDPYYNFQPKNGEIFGFQNVETTKNGIVSEICQSILSGDNRSPIRAGTSAVWFTTTTSSEHCLGDANSYCIHVQKGSPVDNFNYRIHTNEWMKVKITQPLRGFFTERKLVSSANCANGKTFEKRAVLK
jgi:hypothetical protein